MRKLFRIITASVMALSLSACSDFLSEKLGTNYGQESMISNEKALESAMLGIHRQMSSCGFKDGAFCEWLGPASGLLIWSGTTNLVHPHERWICLHKFTRYSQHPQAYDSFRGFYRTIYLCNHLLDILPDSPVDEAYVDEIRGEVYFVRAMAYFYLVRLYGDVSLHLDAPKDVSKGELYKTRENFWTVYAQIIEDLNVAEQKMRDFDRMVSVAGGNASGRVCDYAAIACRSLVYLTIGSLLESVEGNPDNNFWTSDRADAMMEGFAKIGISGADDAFRLALADAMKVLPAADGGVGREVLKSDGTVVTTFTPFELCPDYRQLFRWTEPEDWQLKERIWAMPRSPESNGAGSGLTMWALPTGYMNTRNVDNFGRCRPDRWFFQRWCEMKDGVKGAKGRDNENIYVDCEDPRLDVNIIHTSYIGEEGRIRECYPTDSRLKPGNMKREGIPYYGKYFDPTFDNSVGNSDFYAMRLAEVYLIAAEANAYLGNTAEAVRLVNIILERARKSTDGAEASQPAAWNAGGFATEDELVTAIFWERCFEMPFEHHEYFDTHRYGAQWIVDNISIPKNVFLSQPEQDDWINSRNEPQEGYRTMYYGKHNVYDEDPALVRKGLLTAYPYDELVYNPFLDETVHDPNLGQNPVEVWWK